MATSTITQNSPGVDQQLAIVTRDAALKAAGLQAQATINSSNIQAAGADLQAQFGQQNKMFLQNYLKNQTEAAASQGRGQLGTVRATFAGAGLQLSGSAGDVYRNEARKAAQNVQNVNVQGMNQLNQAQQQIDALRLQSSQIKASGAQQAQLGLQLADINTHQFI